jgi:Transposase DDE domain
LRAHGTKLYHLGIRGGIAKSTLADANEKRDWRIYKDFTLYLIETARTLYANDSFGIELKNTVYALDTTTIDLCLALFPWARFKKTKAAVKLHTLLDLRGSIPAFIHITDGLVHEVNVLDILPFEAGSFYIMDRGFLDFSRLYTIHQSQAFFVIRAKSNTGTKRVYSRSVDKVAGLRCDQTIKLTGKKAFNGYPQHLRRVKIYDEEIGKYLVFLTNNFDLSALMISLLYQNRWKVELFFKWIKQHLRIKAFFGTSENAVKTQIWIAIGVYVLVAIVKKRLKVDLPLYTILQILSLTLFEKIPLNQLLNERERKTDSDHNSNQLFLFNL